MMNPELLLDQLTRLPEGLALVAVGANKAPYLPNWQRSPLSKAQLEVEIKATRCKAVGVLCGTPSGGLVFLDHDGDSCDRLIEQVSGLDLAEALPITVGITSGRPGRYQLIYRIPKEYWSQVVTRKLKTGTIGDDGKAEMLEFRWNGCQSIVLGYHPMTKTYRYLPGQSFEDCAIAEAPLWLIQQMRPESQSSGLTWAEFERHFQLPIDAVIPLEVCLSKTSRELLTGVAEGYRDNAGAKLARDLLGTANYLNNLGQRFTGEPDQLLDHFCQQCTPPLSAKDRDRLWKSALKDNPGASLSPDYIQSCIKSWQWRQLQSEPKGEQSHTRLPALPVAQKADHQFLTLEDLQLQIHQFVSDAPTDTQLTAQVMAWASQIGKSESTIWALVKSIQYDLERVTSRSDARTEIDHLSRLATYQPRLSHYLHPFLSQPLDRMADWMGTTGMAMLTTLLPTVGSLLPVGTELELNNGTEHVVYPILYTGIVAESGSGKSPAQKTILKPLFRLQAEAEVHYQSALEDWEQECRQSKDSGQPIPSKPKPRDYFTTDATREAVVQIQANQPNHGFLGWFDELSGLIRGQNQYRSGRGTDKESLLSGRDGSAQKVDRAGGKRLFINRSAYSITGSTQPDTLRSLMGDFSDPSGQWARFLWCFLPIQSAPYPEQALHLDISNVLYSVYKKLAEQPPTRYTLSPEARRFYIQWYNELDKLRQTEVRQSLRAVYAKFKSDTGVLALLLHCLNAAIVEQIPAPQIAEGTIQSAIQLSKFYLGQVKLIHSEGDALEGDLTPSYCKILALSQRKGWVSARDIYRARAVCDRKATLDQIRVLMRELVTMGLAIARNEGNRLEIQSISRGDKSPKSGDNPPAFGDSFPPSGDTWTIDKNSCELTSVGHALNGRVTSNGSSVTQNSAFVTTLSPTGQRLKCSPQERSALNEVALVTTEPPQPLKARPPNFVKSSIRVGDVCRYRGPDGAMNVTCWGKNLQVLAIEDGVAKVKADQWVHTYQIEIRYLKKAK